MPWIIAVDGGNRMPSAPRVMANKVRRQQFEQRQQRERGEGEIIAVQPEQREAQQRAREPGEQRREQEAQDDGHAVHIGDRERIGADAEIDVVPEVDVAGLAVQPVPALRDDVGVAAA